MKTKHAVYNSRNRIGLGLVASTLGIRKFLPMLPADTVYA